MNQKKKGNKAERYAAAIWNTWAKLAKKKWKYGRVPQSGGLHWNKTAGTTGDITSTTEGHVLQFCIEVKSHADIDFSHLLRDDLKNVKLLEFWKQCTDDAARAKKIPLLMCRYNGLPKGKFFVVMNTHDIGSLEFHIKGKVMIWGDATINLTIFFSDSLFDNNYADIHINAKYLNKQRNGKTKTKKAR